MPDHLGDETPPTTTRHTDTSTDRKARRQHSAPTAEEWRELLRNEELPDELAQLPFFRRRRARKAWRSARRDARAQWVKRERKKVPTPIGIPIIALVLAGAVAAASWLWPDQNGDTARAKPHSTPSTEQAPPVDTSPTPTPRSSTSKRPNTPDTVAKAFATGYTTRNPAHDDSHTAAVTRAAPYASDGLVNNLRTHDDRDWNKLVAAQAMTASPSDVTVSATPAKEQLPPDTAVRVYRQVTARIDVKGVEDYRYTRHLSVEVSRADVGQPWQVTRVLGVQE